MPNSITSSQIQSLISTVNSGNVTDAYDYLSTQGYAYADWANGVAKGNTIAGASALEFLQGTALMGVGSSVCQTLSLETIQSIKQGMAREYLEVLAQQAQDNYGVTSKDINAQDVWTIHQKVFEQNNLSIKNWTLDAPFQIYQKLYGDQVLEDFWTEVRSTGGTGLDAMTANLTVLLKMKEYAQSSNLEISSLAESWMQAVPGFFSAEQWGKLSDVLSNFGTSLNLKDISVYLGKSLSDFLITPAYGNGNEVIENVKQQVTSAKSTSSPIILDLNNNGVETTGVKQGAYFDHANDGFAEQTGWVGANDGLLVLDLNGNGKIDNGSELFGSETLLANGTKAANGFEALKALDSNGDNQINTDDVAFSNLKIWIDSNGDGFSRASELLSLTEAGITAISTAYANSDVVDANGNSHRQLGTYTRADGSQAAAEDVWFAVDHTYSVATTWVNIPDGIASLPNLTGYGVVRDLQQVLALDESGSLNQLILNYKNEFDEGQRYSLVNQLIYKWANADSVAPQSRGSYVDARQLVALEHFLGDSFYQTGWGVNPGVTAGKKIAAAFTELSNSITAQLEAQTQFSDLYQQVRWLWDDNSQTLQMDLTSVIAVLQNELNADSANGLAVLDGFVRNLKALGWTNPTVWQSLNDGLVATQPNALETLRLAQLDTLTGNAENNRLDGTVADERLLGFSSDDVLNGQAGNDVLEGGAGQDTIEAGAGNDLLIGGTGNDALDGNAGSIITIIYI